MKRLKISIGLGIAIIAGISAFATANNFRNNNYFYLDGIICKPVSEPFTCSSGSHSCVGTIVGVDLNKQLYSDDGCLVPLTKP